MGSGYCEDCNKFYIRIDVHYTSQKHLRNTTLTDEEKRQLELEKSRRIHRQVNEAAKRCYHRKKLARESLSKDTEDTEDTEVFYSTEMNYITHRVAQLPIE